jgi:hypothetical protein
MVFWQGKPKYSEKTCPDATLSTTNPTFQTRARIRAAAVGSQRLTASAIARPTYSISGWVTGDGLDDRGVGVRVPVGSIIFSTSSRLAQRPTQPPIQWVPAHLSPGVKRPGREVDHSSRTSAEIKKIWIYTSTPLYAFMA